MRTLLLVVFLCALVRAEDKIELKPRPLIEAPSQNPGDLPKRRIHWGREALNIGLSIGAAKVADDSVDWAIGPRKALYVGSAAAITVWFWRHHWKLRCGNSLTH